MLIGGTANLVPDQLSRHRHGPMAPAPAPAPAPVDWTLVPQMASLLFQRWRSTVLDLLATWEYRSPTLWLPTSTSPGRGSRSIQHAVDHGSDVPVSFSIYGPSVPVHDTLQGS